MQKARITIVFISEVVLEPSDFPGNPTSEEMLQQYINLATEDPDQFFIDEGGRWTATGELIQEEES